MPSPSPLVRNVGLADFEAEVLHASRERLVLVDFWAGWCQPCRMLAPVLERVVGDYEGRVLLAKVETDREEELAARYDIRGIPNVKAFRDGREVDGFVGVIPEREIRRFIDRHVPDPDQATIDEARRLAREGRRSEAIDRLRPLAEGRPGGNLALELASLLLDQGRSGEAREIAARLVAEDVDENALSHLRTRLAFADILEHPEGVPAALVTAARAIFAGLYDEALDGLLSALASAPAAEKPRLREAFLDALRLLADEEARNTWRRRLARLLH